MRHFVRRSPMPVSAEALFAWHDRPGAFERLAPPWQSVRLEAFDGIRDGDRAVIKMGPGPFAIRWVAEHEAYEPGRQFRDRQVAGPFKSWVHTHRMLRDGDDTSVLEDDITFALPLDSIADPLGGDLAESQLDGVFAYRHRVTAADLAHHAQMDLDPLTVAITGASGLLGSSLSAFLSTGGHRIVRFDRHASSAPDGSTIHWDPASDVLDEVALALAAPDVVIHLAGEPIYAPYWTVEKRRRIWESRTRGTQLLSRALARMANPPGVLLSASGSGIYGDRGSVSLTEEHSPGSGFLADVCQAWEAATYPAEAAGIRTLHLRIGVVLTPSGGALKLALPAFRAALGGYVTPGTQYLPWIALDDVLYAVLHLIKSSLHGPVNLGAPNPVTAEAFGEILGRTLRRPSLWPFPSSALSLLGGDFARETAMRSIRMVPDLLAQDGFSFSYPTLDAALGHVLGTSTTYPLG